MQARSPSHPNGQGQGTRTPRYRVSQWKLTGPGDADVWWVYDNEEGRASKNMSEFEARMKCAVLNAEHDDVTKT